ncbi:MAG TPA: DUF433 domain-containing protein [Candidatus Hydrogenedentes bacterium]|mgnify:CR=1 FL=1|nr:DUF433 domain-containing protein [Candidatus Hydrogenedentota bacterium]
MDLNERIVVDSAILTGKPVIKGTQLAVEFVIDLLAQGWTENDILVNYPGISSRTGLRSRYCTISHTQTFSRRNFKDCRYFFGKQIRLVWSFLGH